MSQLLFKSICRVVAVVLKTENRSVHSESIEINPSKIPNDEERVVLLNLVSQVMKNDVLFWLVNRIDSNVKLNKILRLVSSIFLHLECKWILKKYRVDNDNNLEWLMKQYTVNNYNKATSNDSNTSIGCSDNNYGDGCVDITSATKVKSLEWYTQKYQVDNDTTLDYILKCYQDDNVYESKYSKYKHNDCQLLLCRSVLLLLLLLLLQSVCQSVLLPLLFQSAHQMLMNNDIQIFCSTYGDAHCDSCNNLDTSDWSGRDIDVQVMRNNNSFSCYDDSIKMTSTIKWKILVRRLGSDMNDEYHIETRVITTATMITKTMEIPSMILFK